MGAIIFRYFGPAHTKAPTQTEARVRATCAGLPLSGFVVNRSRWGVFFHSSDAVFSTLGALIKLAGTDHLMIGSLKVEHRSPIVGFFPLITVVVGCVLFDRLDTTLCRGFLLVHLAGQNDLSIGGLEMEVVIAILRFGYFENACHRSSWLLACWSLQEPGFE